MSVEVFGFCGANCKHKVLTIDQTAELIQEMAANNWQVPEGYIPKTVVNSIIEQNTGRELRLFVGTQAEFDKWTGDKSNVFAIISDDPTLKNIEYLLEQYGQSINSINNTILNIIDGITRAGDAEKVQGVDLSADTAATFGDYIVEKKKLLWSSKYGFAIATTITDEYLKIENVDINYDDTIEICFYAAGGSVVTGKTNMFVKFKLPSSDSDSTKTVMHIPLKHRLIAMDISFNVNGKYVAVYKPEYIVNSTDTAAQVFITKIYKVVE